MNKENEIWKTIKGNYQISNYGNVRMFNNDRKIINITPLVTPNGNPYVIIDNKKYLIKTLVGKLFIHNPNNCSHIIHIDKNIKNNNFNNLQWCNMLIDEEIKSKTRKVYQVDIYSNKPLALYRSIKVASRITGIKNGLITKCCNGELEQCGGYKWKYAN